MNIVPINKTEEIEFDANEVCAMHRLICRTRIIDIPLDDIVYVQTSLKKLNTYITALEALDA